MAILLDFIKNIFNHLHDSLTGCAYTRVYLYVMKVPQIDNLPQYYLRL